MQHRPFASLSLSLSLTLFSSVANTEIYPTLRYTTCALLMKLPAAILLRSPKGGGGRGGGSSKGSSSHKSSSGGSSFRPVGYYGGGGCHGSCGKSKLPWWAILLIVYFSLFITIFLVALCHYCYKERCRKKEDGKSIRAGRAVWKAFCAASGLWLIIWLVKLCRGDRKSREGPRRTGTYSKIQEGHGDEHNDGGPRSGAWPVGGDARYDEPLEYGQQRHQQQHQQHQQHQHQHQHQQQQSMQWPREQPIITGPVEQTSAIPIPSPTASPAPSILSAMAAPPPPYTGPATGPDVNKPLPPVHPAGPVSRPASNAALPPPPLFGAPIESPAAAHNMYTPGGSYNAGYLGPRGGAY